MPLAFHSPATTHSPWMDAQLTVPQSTARGSTPQKEVDPRGSRPVTWFCPAAPWDSLPCRARPSDPSASLGPLGVLSGLGPCPALETELWLVFLASPHPSGSGFLTQPS